MARIRAVKSEFWSSPELKNINYKHVGTFEVKPPGWGRWGHFPGIPDEISEYIYFVSDAHGTVIYIGKAGNVRGRMQGHVSKPWFENASSVSVYQILGITNTDAEFNAWEVERLAIAYFRPAENKSPGGVPAKSRFNLNPYGGSTVSELRGRV